MLRTSMREINVFNSQISSAGAIGIINLEKHFLNFIADTMNCFPNLMLGLRPFYARVFRNQNFMVTWFTKVQVGNDQE